MPRVTDWLDRFQQRHRWAGFPLAVVYKFADDQGPYLAALITYYGFLSLFPLLLLLASILGFVLEGNPDLQGRILDSALRQLPVIGEELGDPQGLPGNGPAVVIGGLVALYGALGFAQALQNALNIAWSVPRHRRPNPLMARLRSVLIVGTAGLAVLATTVVSVLASRFEANDSLFNGWTVVPIALVAIAINTAIFAVAFSISTAAHVSRRDVLPGAVTAAVVWQVLQLFGAAYVKNVVNDSGTTYGVFAIVLGLLAWIYLATVGVVVSAEINVVRSKRLYPRSLLTPFTDNVDLTRADQRVYTDAAEAQSHKGFEDVDVSFHHDGQNATARKQAKETTAGPTPPDDRENDVGDVRSAEGR